MCITLSLFSLIPSASAFDINPTDPTVGDEIIVTGDSSTNTVPAKIVFTKTVQVENGEYLYYIGKVAIPEGPNNFLVEATNVEDLEVKAKLMFWFTAAHPSATNGKASYSMSNVPKGSYSIKLTGNAQPAKTSVDMKITATSEIPVKDGSYEFRYSTSSMPEGNFKLTIDGETKTIHLNSPSSDTSTSDSNSGSGGSSGGSGGGASPDKDAKNVLITESTNLRVISGTPAEHHFEHTSNPVTYIKFTSSVTARSVPITIEILKETSELVKETPEGIVYKNLNIWVGYEGFAIPKNIKDALLEFNVNTAWLEENNIDPHRVSIMHYNSGSDQWETVPTTYIKTLDGIAYYQSTPDSFSPFAIVGIEDKENQMSIDETETDSSYQDSNDPNKRTVFSYNLVTLIAGITILTGSLIFYRKKHIKE
ncbi:PGF-pre-PGF domain-containing protein [Methanococcoides burtonii]|uniref:PGF-pre-PGF domain-containing protein n=1 Tax=Methanococcoides burtonii TaxID=29291 RepID=UPI0018DB9B3C|nr:PGF-pre-PGF domain-containing protein [Methanococcoides burtonii]